MIYNQCPTTPTKEPQPQSLPHLLHMDGYVEEVQDVVDGACRVDQPLQQRREGWGGSEVGREGGTEVGNDAQISKQPSANKTARQQNQHPLFCSSRTQRPPSNTQRAAAARLLLGMHARWWHCCCCCCCPDGHSPLQKLSHAKCSCSCCWRCCCCVKLCCCFHPRPSPPHTSPCTADVPGTLCLQ